MSRVPLSSVAYAESRAATRRMPVATHTGVHKQGYETVDVAGHTSHQYMQVSVDSAADLFVRFIAAEWMVNPLPSGVLLVDCVLVMPVTKKLIPFSFTGEPTLTLDSSSGKVFPVVDSDVLCAELFRGQEPFVRTFVRAAAGVAPVGVDYYSGTDTLSWFQAGDHLFDDPAVPPVAPGPAYANTYMFTPSALMAEHVELATP